VSNGGPRDAGEERGRRAWLRAHGLSAAAIEAVVRTHARRLVDHTRRSNREHAVTLEAETGEQLGAELVGDRFGIDLAPHLAAMRPGRAYLQIHTHPSDCAFSLQDAAMLYRFTAVRVVLVLGVRGTWYLLSRRPGPDSAVWDVLVAAFEAEYVARTPAYQAAVSAGELSRRAAQCRRVDGAWGATAARCGLLYTRIDREAE
jgi:hypothetical protein